MARNPAVFFVYGTAFVLLTAASPTAGQYGTAEEAKVMLGKAVAAVKTDKVKAFEMFRGGLQNWRARRFATKNIHAL
jgi:hypothetical protein